MKTKHKAVAAYVRVSTVGQNAAGQRAEIEQWLSGNGINPATVRWYVDKKTGEVLHEAGYYRKVYDEYKTKKEQEIVKVCQGCDGAGKTTNDNGKKIKCRNCGGTGGPAPWGRSPGHRHNAATRYMEKRLVRDIWRAWRDCK